MGMNLLMLAVATVVRTAHPTWEVVVADDVMGPPAAEMDAAPEIQRRMDALGKAATMLQIPHRGLWARIPGVEASDVREWERLADELAEADPLSAIVRRHNADTSVSGASGDPLSTDVPVEG